MGGPGSGSWYRWDKKPKMEDAFRLNVRDLKKYNIFDTGGSGLWSWHCNGKKSGEVGYHLMGNRFVLDYRVDGRSMHEVIQLTTTQCNYGGQRYWFLCPGCNRRVGVLVSITGLFRCRQCQRLGYESENYEVWDRVIAKRDKIRRKLDSGKRMRKLTRTKLQAEWIHLEMRSERFLEAAMYGGLRALRGIKV